LIQLKIDIYYLVAELFRATGRVNLVNWITGGLAHRFSSVRQAPATVKAVLRKDRLVLVIVNQFVDLYNNFGYFA